jgi:hypothetical protein
MSEDPGRNLPIACTLTSAELQERRRTVLEKVRSAVIETVELKNGYAFSIPVDWFAEVARLIELERQCCPFLNFNLNVAAGAGLIRLELTGPEGTKQFLAATFMSTPIAEARP